MSNKRIFFFLFILIIFLILVIYKLYNLQILSNEYYKNKLSDLKTSTVQGTSVPRGRIYDRNYNLLVDNVGVKTIYYKRNKGTTTKDILDTIKLLKDNIEIDTSNVSIRNIKDYYIVTHKEEMNNRITEEEYNKYKERRITKEDLYDLKLNRVSEE